MRQHFEIRIRVSNLQDTIAFYDAALEPVGVKSIGKRPDGQAVGFGIKRLCKARIFLWLIAPGAPLTIDHSLLSPSSTNQAGDTSPLLGTQSFDMLEKGDDPASDDRGVTKNVHICVPTFKRANVDNFYQRAVAAGGKAVLPAACRPSPYNGRWYYNAVVQDLEGRSVEVACRSFPLVSGKYGWISKMVFFTLLIIHMSMFMSRHYYKGEGVLTV